MNGTNRVIAIVKLAADFGTFFAMVFVGIQTCTLKQQIALQFLTTRPFVYLAPGADINSGTTFYRVVNRSAIPARIISKDLKGWVNGQKLPTLPESEDKFTQMIVTGDEGVALPGVRIESFGPEPKAYSEAFKLLRSGKHCLETAACIIYESIDSTDVRRWQFTARHTLGRDESMSFVIQGDEDDNNEKVVNRNQQCKIVETPKSCQKAP